MLSWILFINKTCVEKDKNCLNVKDNVGCTSCYPGYYLYNNTCVGKDKNCLNVKDNVGCHHVILDIIYIIIHV